MGFFEPVTELFKLIKELVLWLFAKKRLNEQRKLYLERCLSHTEHLGEDWISDAKEGQTRLRLDAAFVLVNLLDARGGDVTLREVLGHQRCVVLQGPPGAGKSTLVRFITRVMASALLPGSDPSLAERRLALLPHFPIRIPLKSYDQSKDLMALALDDLANPLTIEQFDILTKKGAMLLLDGLDEVALQHIRPLISEIDRLVKNHPEYRFVVTTRITTYRVKDLAPSGFMTYTVQSLNQHQQDQLLYRYFRYWSQTQSSVHQGTVPIEQRVQEFRSRIEQNPTLARLVAIPLWLTLTASLFYTNDLRPFVSKPEIYRLCIENLLHRRNITEQTDQHLLLLAEIAWEIHNSPNTTLSRKQIEGIVQRVTNREPGGQFPTRPTVDQLESDWGILIQRSQSRQQGDVYSFAQQGFQDYLVALAVAQLPADHWPIMKDHLEDVRWREIVLLYTAMTTKAAGSEPLKQVLDALMPAATDERAILVGMCLANAPVFIVRNYERILDQLAYIVGRAHADDRVVTQALEALALIVPAGRDRVLKWIDQKANDNGYDLLPEPVRALGAEARQVLRTSLIEQIETLEKPQDRIRQARLLAQIGDTRIGNTTPISNPVMAADHSSIMLRASIYPVTNAEYALFVQASHRDSPRHWPAGRFKPPEANYPVTNVSFDDAQAYCDWLSENTDHRVFLPTDEQWTTLAGGSHRRFPWGDDFVADYANYRNNCGCLIPVGIFHEGKSDLGIMDLIGNVWEWTTTIQGGRLVVRGGAYDTMTLDQGLAIRELVDPRQREPNIGFRVLHEIREENLGGSETA